jgi:hypothetical protein
MDGPALPDSRAEVITPIADNCMRKPLWPLARLETFMRRRTVLVVLMLVASASFAPANFARAQIGDESTRIVARCIDDSAVAVAHVDLGRVDIGVAARQLAEIAQGGAAGVDLAALNSLADSAQKLKAAGVQNVYAVFTPTRLGDRNPYYVALVEPGRDVAAASQLIKSQTANPTRLFVVAMNEDSFPSVATFGNAIVAADRGLIARLQQSAPAPRPELQAAMSAAATAPVSLLLVPSADQRKAVEETLPELPQTFGSGPVTLFTRGLIWAAIAYTPERGTWELVIQSENSAAAEALRRVFGNLLVEKSLSRRPTSRRARSRRQQEHAQTDGGAIGSRRSGSRNGHNRGQQTNQLNSLGNESPGSTEIRRACHAQLSRRPSPIPGPGQLR